MKYQMPGMDSFVEGLVLERRVNSFTIKRVSDGHVFNTHAGDIDIKETELERKELSDRLSEPRKEFDISEYEFSDGDISIHNVIWDRYELYVVSECIELNKQDVIALAKHFKLTSGDLK